MMIPCKILKFARLIRSLFGYGTVVSSPCVNLEGKPTTDSIQSRINLLLPEQPLHLQKYSRFKIEIGKKVEKNVARLSLVRLPSSSSSPHPSCVFSFFFVSSFWPSGWLILHLLSPSLVSLSYIFIYSIYIIIHCRLLGSYLSVYLALRGISSAGTQAQSWPWGHDDEAASFDDKCFKLLKFKWFVNTSNFFYDH